MPPVLSALLAFVVAFFQSRQTMHLKILALQHQVAVYKQTVARPRLRPSDRVFWAWLSRLWPSWQGALQFVQPHTVIAWQHRRLREHWRRWGQVRLRDFENELQLETPSLPPNLTLTRQAYNLQQSQIEARLNQHTEISQQISLWHQAGSRVSRGNLRVLPMATSVLEVSPWSLRAETGQLPERKRVMAAYGDRVVMAETLPGALRVLCRETAPLAQVPAAQASTARAGPAAARTQEALNA
jgi:hypothetical protein